MVGISRILGAPPQNHGKRGSQTRLVLVVIDIGLWK